MNVQDYKLAIDAAFNARIDYQTAKITAETKGDIVKTLRELHRDSSHERIAEIMMLSNVDANYINRQERDNARFNVKSATKVVNVARVLAKVATLNHYTIAALRSMHSFHLADVTFCQSDAVAAMSLSVNCKDVSKNKHLVRYASHTSPSTASTQSSSSLNALQMYGVVIEYRDAANVVCFKIDYSNANAQALLAYLEIDYTSDDANQLTLI